MEVIAATRHGTQVYVYEDFTFRKTREVKDKVYVRCCVRGCPSTAVVCGEDVTLRRPHNHEPETTRIEKLKLREDLRLSAMKHGSRQNMRRIFEETCGKHASGAKLDYKSIRSSMYRAKRIKDFPIPNNLGEYSDVLAEKDELGKTKDDPPQAFFQRYIERRTRTSKGEEQWSAVVFISPTLKQLLSSSSTIHIDVSTKALPNDLGQKLLTVHVLHAEHLFPVVYVLIDGKSEESYTGVLNEIVTMCPETRQSAQFIITDYDLPIMNAANSAWPNAVVTGNFFHYAQDIFRKHISLDMRAIVLGNESARSALHMLMALPILPPALIVDGLHEIHQYLLENGLQATFSQLVEHIEEYWMTTVSPHNVSVYQQMHRTNNGIAGFYFNFLSKLGTQRGVWHFTEVLLSIEHTYTLDYTKLLNGRPISSERRKGQRAQDLGIEKVWKSLSDKGFHLLGCLITASHAVEGLEERVKELMRVEGNPPPIVVPVVLVTNTSSTQNPGTASLASLVGPSNAMPTTSNSSVADKSYGGSSGDVVCGSPLSVSSKNERSNTPNNMAMAMQRLSNTNGGSNLSSGIPVTTVSSCNTSLGPNSCVTTIGGPSAPSACPVNTVGSSPNSFKSSPVVGHHVFSPVNSSVATLGGQNNILNRDSPVLGPLSLFGKHNPHSYRL